MPAIVGINQGRPVPWCEARGEVPETISMNVLKLFSKRHCFAKRMNFSSTWICCERLLVTRISVATQWATCAADQR